jgi:hypothetical protein
VVEGGINCLYSLPRNSGGSEPVLAAEVRDLVLAGRMKAVRASLTHVNWSSTYERQNNPFLECFGCVYILDKVGHRLK